MVSRGRCFPQKQHLRYYKRLKAPRTLEWMPGMGTVTLELELASGAVTATVTPFQASVLMHFQDQPLWQEADLAEAMELEEDTLRRRMQFWVAKGLVASVGGGAWRLVEDYDGPLGGLDDALCAGEEEDGDGRESIGKEQDWKSIEPFIVNTLTSLQSLVSRAWSARAALSGLWLRRLSALRGSCCAVVVPRRMTTGTCACVNACIRQAD